MVKTITGDLIQSAKNGEFDVICHGCNIFNTMGSGIARSLRDEWPEVYDVDCETIKGDETKLGDITYTKNIPNLTVINCYTQKNYGRAHKVYADYDAIESSLKKVKEQFKGKKIGMPKIGAGLARGDWNKIYGIIQAVFSDSEDDVTVVEWVNDAPVKPSDEDESSKSNEDSTDSQSKPDGIIGNLSVFNR